VIGKPAKPTTDLHVAFIRTLTEARRNHMEISEMFVKKQEMQH